MRLADWIKHRFAKPAVSADAEGELCISVSDMAWQTTLRRPGEPPLHGTSPEPVPGSPAASPLDMVRRAVRTVTPSQREQIGRVRLQVSDASVVIVDNRLTRIRSTDPVAIRQAGAQELGCADAVFGFQPYGVSGEQEAERGVFAFLPTTVARDYIGGLDSLAAKLVQVVPVQFTRMAQVAEQPFIALTIGANNSDLLIGDAESGAITSRVLPLGVQSFAKALADATSIPLRQAAEGLVRRNCLPALAAPGMDAPVTATERALRPLAEALQSEILASLDYMRFQRLGQTPELLLLDGEVDGIRGLEAWLTQLLPIEMRRGADLHASFTSGTAPASANMLEGSAKGLLKIGKNEFRFEGGRFVTEQVSPVRTAKRKAADDQPAQWMHRWRELVPHCDLRRLAVPAIITVVATAGSLLATVQSGAARQEGVSALSDILTEDTMLHAAMLRRLTAEANRTPEPLFLTDKLRAVARDLPEAVWVDRIATFNDGPVGTRDNRLTLEGSVGAGGADYLGRLNALIAQLSADATFMADVAAISLTNAAVAPSRNDNLATFTITVSLKPAAVRRS